MYSLLLANPKPKLLYPLPMYTLPLTTEGPQPVVWPVLKLPSSLPVSAFKKNTVPFKSMLG